MSPVPAPETEPVDRRAQKINRTVNAVRVARERAPKKSIAEEKKAEYEQAAPDAVIQAIKLGNFDNLVVCVGLKGDLRADLYELDGDQKQEVMAALHNPISRLGKQIEEVEAVEATAAVVRVELLEAVDAETPTAKERADFLKALDGDPDADPPTVPDYDDAITKAEAILPEDIEQVPVETELIVR